MIWGRGCIVLLVLALVAIGVNGQLDSLGFISIDCGIRANSTTIAVDSMNKLFYISDDQYIDTGVNSQIQLRYFSNTRMELLTVRSFPSGTRNCYTLRSLTAGSKYLIRAVFMYAPDELFDTEVITVAPADYLQVCLINKNQGTPFISWLDLRPLDTSMYQFANSTYSLITLDRLNLGASSYFRYPTDPYDRFWFNYTSDTETWTEIFTTSNVSPDKDFATPSLVMQTAVTSSSSIKPLDIFWTSDNASNIFLVILHIGEIQNLLTTSHREFDILATGDTILTSYVPSKLYSASVCYIDTGHTKYNVSLIPNSNSTLPPLLNAFELYALMPVSVVLTYSGDVSAMNAIKANYKVNKGWSGDPCAPKELSWSGLTCSSTSSNTLRITAIDLSSSGLTGNIASSFGNLSALKSLDLSNNDLSGDLPAFLDELTALTYLDITGNGKISTTLPPGLQKKQEAGTLTYNFGSSAQAVLWSSKKKTPTIVGVVVVILLAAVIILVVFLKRNKNNQINIPMTVGSHSSSPIANSYAGYYANSPEVNSHASSTGQNYASEVEGMLNIEKQFTYNDLIKITNNFQNKIGTGGFGSVYVGKLENGTLVAVKTRSQSSSQGVKEFLAEAQNLTRVHHKNLVSLLGYCMDEYCMALVYEYMQEGTLQDRIRDNRRTLTWKQRLQIGYESAQGLEYLHKACNPPLIHRDVKTNNILLNFKLEAKIADFGLSKAFNPASTHVSTAVVGTQGYLDPEYYSSYQISEKSDVFSFGVVLLEIITGQPPIIPGPDGGHVARWVSQKLARGDIESIVDPRMQGQYDLNSVWKVTELARICTAPTSAQRPTMSGVVSELKESLDLEKSTEGTRNRNTTCTNPQNISRNDNYVNDVSQNSNFEMVYMDSMAASGPTAR